MQLIPRKEYLDWLCRWQDKQIIKVVSGVRRCGKSTLFTLFKQNLLKHAGNSSLVSIYLLGIPRVRRARYHRLSHPLCLPDKPFGGCP